jgi:iron complex transport system ATP-binding protein
VIAFDRVVVRYPATAQAALDDVSFTAAPGALTAVVGPNGSGKSTLVRAILGRVPLSSGGISLLGARIGALTRREVARRVAVVVQREEPVFPMRVRDYLALGRHPVLGAWSPRGESEAAVRAASRGAGVDHLVDRTTDRLSGGEWQRVRIARALAQESPAIVMDEPTTALDIGHEMETFELLEELASQGRTVLVVSHQLNLVVRFATHIVLLSRGRAVAVGTPDDVMRTEVLEPVYEWPLTIDRNAVLGTAALTPLRRPRSPNPSPQS